MSQPAFPEAPFYHADIQGYDQKGSPGMSLLEFYAGIAMHALLSAQAKRSADRSPNGEITPRMLIDSEIVAQQAFQFAATDDRRGSEASPQERPL